MKEDSRRDQFRIMIFSLRGSIFQKKKIQFCSEDSVLTLEKKFSQRSVKWKDFNPAFSANLNVALTMELLIIFFFYNNKKVISSRVHI